MSSGRIDAENQLRPRNQIQKFRQIARNVDASAGKTSLPKQDLHFLKLRTLTFRPDQQDLLCLAVGLQRAKSVLPKRERINLCRAGDRSTDPAIL